MTTKLLIQVQLRQALLELPRFSCNARVVRVSRRSEQRLDLRVIEPIDEHCLEQRRFAPRGHELTQHPLEVLPRTARPGQDIDGVLQRHGANASEAAPHLDPEVTGLWRELMDQHQPPAAVLRARRLHGEKIQLCAGGNNR